MARKNLESLMNTGVAFTAGALIGVASRFLESHSHSNLLQESVISGTSAGFLMTTIYTSMHAHKMKDRLKYLAHDATACISALAGYLGAYRIF